MEKRDGTSLAGVNSLLEKLVDFFEISIISLIKKKENLDAVDIRCAEGRNVIVPIRLSCLFWTTFLYLVPPPPFCRNIS